MKNQLYKMYRWSGLDAPINIRQNENDFIAALVRIGYDVYMTDDYICFKIGVDDKIEEIKE